MIIDGHIHFSLPYHFKEIANILDITKTDKANLVSLYDKRYASANLDCLMAKAESNGRLYVYGALDNTAYIKGKDVGKNLAEHVKHIMACGCDGIKMLEGKPTSRKRYPIPNFDDEDYDAYFDYVEKNNINIVWHVNDPEEFWDDKLCPDWARRSGWFYSDGTFVNNEDQYSQIYNVLKRHPNLRIHFAHFYFLSAQLPRLGKLFDEFPNIGVDITPGIEMYTNMSKDVKEAKAFFIKYQDRIQYGTDISSDTYFKEIGFDIDDSLIRAKLCYDFLAKDHVFIPGNPASLLGADDLDINGLSLDQKIVDKVMGGNFLRENGEPKKVNYAECLKEADREKEKIEFLSEHYEFEPDYSRIDEYKQFFK